MKVRNMFLLLALIIIFGFAAVSMAQIQPGEKLTAQEKQQLEQQQVRVEHGAQQQSLEEHQEQLKTQAISEQDMYLFNGKDNYDPTTVYVYSHRGSASRWGK